MGYGRYGDKIQGVGRIDGRGDIIWDRSTFKTVEPSIRASDRVKWFRDRDGWLFGKVLATQVDPTNDTTWAWIEEEGKWPRLTLSTKELTRVEPEGEVP